MKVEMDISNLTNALKALSGIKADMLVKVNRDTVILTKADKETTLIAFLTCDSYEDGRTLIPHETTEHIRKLKDGCITLTEDVIKTRNKVIKFEQKSIENNHLEPIWEEAFRTTEEELLRMLEVKYAIAQEPTRLVLCGVYFGGNETCALDGYRLSVRKGNYNSDKSFVVNKNTIGILNNLLDVKLNRKVTVYYSNEKVKFTIGNVLEVIGDTIPGEFIKYNSIIPSEHGVIAKVNLNKLKEELNFLNGLKTNYLKLSFIEDRLTLNSDQCKEVYDEKASRMETEELQKSAHEEYRQKYSVWFAKKSSAEKK